MENKNDKANSCIDNIKTRASCRSGDTILISNNNECNNGDILSWYPTATWHYLFLRILYFSQKLYRTEKYNC